MKKIFMETRSIILLSLFLFSCGQTQEQDVKEMSESMAVPVRVVTVESLSISHVISYTGNIEPWKEVNIVPNIAGKVASINVKEGDHVKKGQLLAKLDTESFKLGLEQAKAGLGVAEAAFADAEKDWNRMKVLIEDNTISQIQYDKAELGYNSAKAGLQQAKAAVDLMEYNLRVAVMRAPFDGIVTNKHMNEDETINPMMPGGPGVVTMMDFSKVKIKALASDIDLPYLKPGLKVQVQVDTYPDETFEGTVFVVNPAAARQSRLFEIQLQIPNPELKLRPGMFARIEVIAEERNDVSTLPLSAIISPESDSYVFVVNGGKAERRNVILGISEDETVEIISGLQIGETVVNVGQAMLEDGTPVVIKGGETQ
ncbi:MAG: efflux RND transporter periplasmic adaptor subunit [Deltaproteobacteria bacterium]|nr:efflux RND transporter periplasmic adaptor subunit [Deltaproteobacteria bacterium]